MGYIRSFGPARAISGILCKNRFAAVHDVIHSDRTWEQTLPESVCYRLSGATTATDATQAAPHLSPAPPPSSTKVRALYCCKLTSSCVLQVLLQADVMHPSGPGLLLEVPLGLAILSQAQHTCGKHSAAGQTSSLQPPRCGEISNSLLALPGI